MQFITPFCHKDAKLAEKLCGWLGELGGLNANHRCLLLAAKATPAELRVPVLEAARKNLKCPVEMAETATANEKGWPESCNHLFYSAAAKMRRLGVPFMWLEPDCVPLRETWLDEIEAEYKSCQMPYMGTIYDKPWRHLTGCAVYPPNISQFNPISLFPQRNKKGAFPWDVVDAPATIRYAHETKLICHEWGRDDAPPSFPTLLDLERVPKSAALFHRCKDGSLIERLRESRRKPSLISRISKSLFGDDTKSAVGVVQLGRMGDIINILPICRHLHSSGNNPHLYVAAEFAPLLEGVSYVQCCPLNVEFDDLRTGVAAAKSRHSQVIVPQVHQKGIATPTKTSNYNTEEWLRAGYLDRFHDPAWLPAFDRRDASRELLLCESHFKTSKPKILVNLTAALSSPFKSGALVLKAVLAELSDAYEIVDLSKFKAVRFYDLLGMYEKASLIVSIDTATLHLAAACKTPIMALTSDEYWVTSVPRGNCVRQIRYDKATPSEVVNAIRYELGEEAESKRRLTALLAKPLKSQPRLDLKRVTLWGCCWSSNQDVFLRTLRVLRYCSQIIAFKRVVFFTFMRPPKVGFPLDCQQIPELDMNGFTVLHCRVLPRYLDEDEFAMSIHDDGFPLDTNLWQDDFLKYDFIGAPWAFDGKVGNAGFCIESNKFLKAKMNLPFAMPPLLASDVFPCLAYRSQMEQAGIKFAPTELAVQFSTEQTGARWPSFGFHGRRDQPVKYAKGWELVAQSEEACP